MKVWGRGEFVAAATAKVDILRGPWVVLRFSYPMINGYDRDLSFNATAKMS